MIKVVKTYIYTTKQTISRQKPKMMNAISNIKNALLGDVAEAERQKAEQTKMMQAQIKENAEENKKTGELACRNAQQIIENKIEIGIVKSHVAKNDEKIEVLQRSYEQTDEFVGMVSQTVLQHCAELNVLNKKQADSDAKENVPQSREAKFFNSFNIFGGK